MIFSLKNHTLSLGMKMSSLENAKNSIYNNDNNVRAEENGSSRN